MADAQTIAVATRPSQSHSPLLRDSIVSFWKARSRVLPRPRVQLATPQSNLHRRHFARVFRSRLRHDSAMSNTKGLR